MDIEQILGKTFKEIRENKDDNQLTFIEDDGTEYRMYHCQD